MKGRKSEPAVVQLAKGNPGRRRIRSISVDAIPHDAGDAPDYLSPLAASLWRALAPELHRIKFLGQTDEPAFARYCTYLALWRAAVADVEANGGQYEVNSKHGSYVRDRPSKRDIKDLESMLSALEDRFGLTPRARHQIFQMIAGLAVVPNQRELVQGAGAASPIGLLNRASSAEPDDSSIH